MKNHKFWIIVSVLFVVLVGLYLVLVSNEREKADREKKQKDGAIKTLEKLKVGAQKGDIPSDIAIANVENASKAFHERIQEIESYIKDSHKDFLYIKGDKEWAYLPDTALQYKSWYDKKRDEIFGQLKQSGFVFEVEGKTQLDSSDENKMKEALGFKVWGSETPPEKELLEAQQQLALIGNIAEALSGVFKNEKTMYPILQKVTFEDWMELDTVNNLQKSKATIRIDCPFVMINIIINALEKSRLRMNVENVEISKKANAKDYSEYPNVSIIFNINFQVIANRKAIQ